MAGSAAHLVDRVLPSVPLRQYVLAFPYELSGLAATRPEVLAALSPVFWESLRMHYQGWAKAAGHATSGRVETGAVTGVHRAGASLNVHVHFHLLCLDGVYVDDGERLRFEPAPASTRAGVTSMLQRIYARVRDPDATHDSNAAREVSPAEALATAGMQRGSLVTVRERDDGADDDEPRTRASLQVPRPAGLLACAPPRTARRQRLVPREEGHARAGNPARDDAHRGTRTSCRPRAPSEVPALTFSRRHSAAPRPFSDVLAYDALLSDRPLVLRESMRGRGDRNQPHLGDAPVVEIREIRILDGDSPRTSAARARAT